LTFAAPPAASSQGECQILNSARTLYLLVWWFSEKKIERQDRDALAGNVENELVVRAADTPDNGERHATVRLCVSPITPAKTMLINMIEDRTGQVASNEAAA
jgi:hypothetical protein